VSRPPTPLASTQGRPLATSIVAAEPASLSRAPVPVAADGMPPIAIPTDRASSGEPKRDIRGFFPGMPSNEAMKVIRAAGLNCSDENAVGYRRCKNQYDYWQIGYEEYGFYSLAGIVYAVSYSFVSGNDFQSLVQIISDQYDRSIAEVGPLDRASWRLKDGSSLRFRKNGTLAVLTIGNAQVERGLRAAAAERQRQINPSPRF
ncbi:hypothetical protein, partial [Heyndrickxia sporothermodurans]